MSDAQVPKEQNISGTLPHNQDHMDLARLLDVKVTLSIELGRRRLTIHEILELKPQSILELYKRADEPLDIRVNGRLVARGEAVVTGDRYGVRITEVVNPSHTHIHSAAQFLSDNEVINDEDALTQPNISSGSLKNQPESHE